MATTGDHREVAIVTTADLSACQYLCVTVAGTVASTVGGGTTGAIGVLKNKPKLGEQARVAFDGHMKGLVGAGVTAGDMLVTTTSGYLITNATSTSGSVGRALKTANSGSVVEFLGDFINARASYSIGII